MKEKYSKEYETLIKSKISIEIQKLSILNSKNEEKVIFWEDVKK
jgi:hypothetical protein